MTWSILLVIVICVILITIIYRLMGDAAASAASASQVRSAHDRVIALMRDERIPTPRLQSMLKNRSTLSSMSLGELLALEADLQDLLEELTELEDLEERPAPTLDLTPAYDRDGKTVSLDD